MTVRPATADDAGGIAAVHVASWRSAYRGIVDDDRLARLDEGEHTARWQEWLDEDLLVLVAEDPQEHHLTGFVAAIPSTAEIAALYIAPRQTRTGLGTRLLDAAHDALRATGHTEAHLWVFAANAPARAFYAARGYAPDGTTGEKAGKPVVRMVTAL